MHLLCKVEAAIKICAALAKAKKPMGPGELGKLLKHNQTTIRSLCWKMVQAGILEQAAFRVYKLRASPARLTLLDVWEAAGGPITFATTDEVLDAHLAVAAEHVREALRLTPIENLGRALADVGGPEVLD